MSTKCLDIFDHEIAKDPVVAVGTSVIGEETKEKKHVADCDTLLCEVALGRTGLTKRATTIVEHRVFMAKVVRTQSTLCHPGHNFAKAHKLVSCHRPPIGGDWQADGDVV